MDKIYDIHERKTLINRKTLLAMVPISDRNLYNLEARGQFPRRIVLSPRRVAWDLAEIEGWIESRKQSDEKAFCPPNRYKHS